MAQPYFRPQLRRGKGGKNKNIGADVRPVAEKKAQSLYISSRRERA